MSTKIGGGIEELLEAAEGYRQVLPTIAWAAKQAIQNHAALPPDRRVEAARAALPAVAELAAALRALGEPWTEVEATLKAVIERASITRIQ